MSSVWIETTEKPNFAKFQDGVSTDVLIIGGGTL